MKKERLGNGRRKIHKNKTGKEDTEGRTKGKNESEIFMPYANAYFRLK